MLGPATLLSNYSLRSVQACSLQACNATVRLQMTLPTALARRTTQLAAAPPPTHLAGSGLRAGAVSWRPRLAAPDRPCGAHGHSCRHISTRATPPEQPPSFPSPPQQLPSLEDWIRNHDGIVHGVQLITQLYPSGTCLRPTMHSRASLAACMHARLHLWHIMCMLRTCCGRATCIHTQHLPTHYACLPCTPNQLGRSLATSPNAACMHACNHACAWPHARPQAPWTGS